MAKVRKRRRLLRVLIAAALLVVAVPTVAAAHEHLDPVDALYRGHHTGAGAGKAACSVDPRHAALMKPGAQMCRNYHDTADEVPTGQGRASHHPVSPDEAARIDHVPTRSDRMETEIWWWMLGVVVASGGVAGLIVGLRRGRPHALS
jgi:hypothetical protein